MGLPCLNLNLLTIHELHFAHLRIIGMEEVIRENVGTAFCGHPAFVDNQGGFTHLLLRYSHVKN